MNEYSSAHDKDPTTLRYRPIFWRPPGDIRDYRTCSYCGSIHPADMLRRLAGNANVHLADMKYGWPHKFYGGDMEKFYSVHLLDAEDETFNALAIRLSPAGVDFTRRENGELYWRMQNRKAPT